MLFTYREYTLARVCCILEGSIPEALVQELEQLNYSVNRWQNLNMYFGGTHAVALEDGRWVAIGDRRRGGAGLVVS